MSSINDFSRADERRLEELKKELEGTQRFHSDVLQAEYDDLLRRNNLFLEEGLRRLQNGVSDASQRPSISWGALRSGVAFWSSLGVRSVPLCVNAITGMLPSQSHWHWITDQIVLGGVPMLTRVGTSGDHLNVLKRQIDTKHDTEADIAGRHQLQLVVACLNPQELDGFGVGVVQFAKKFDWLEVFGAGLTYINIPIDDGTADVSISAVRSAVDSMHNALSEDLRTTLLSREEKVRCPKPVVYVHCKAGVGRSWMVLMCYLTTHGGRTFSNAEQLIRLSRSSVNPSTSQRQFVIEFTAHFESENNH